MEDLLTLAFQVDSLVLLKGKDGISKWIGPGIVKGTDSLIPIAERGNMNEIEQIPPHFYLFTRQKVNYMENIFSECTFTSKICPTSMPSMSCQKLKAVYWKPVDSSVA
jgi:hypothetical protein